MAIKRAQIDIKSKIKIHIYMATYLCQKTRESSIEAIQRTIAQSKFSLTAAPPARASQNCEIRATDKIKKLLKQAEAAGGKLDIELEEYSISVEHILAERYR